MSPSAVVVSFSRYFSAFYSDSVSFIVYSFRSVLCPWWCDLYAGRWEFWNWFLLSPLDVFARNMLVCKYIPRDSTQRTQNASKILYEFLVVRYFAWFKDFERVFRNIFLRSYDFVSLWRDELLTNNINSMCRNVSIPFINYEHVRTWGSKAAQNKHICLVWLA